MTGFRVDSAGLKQVASFQIFVNDHMGKHTRCTCCRIRVIFTEFEYIDFSHGSSVVLKGVIPYQPTIPQY